MSPSRCVVSTTRRLFAWSAVAFALATSANAAEQADALQRIVEQGSIEFAVYKDFPPFSGHGGKARSGIDIELGRALAKKLGVQASFRLIGADENVDDDLRNNVWKGHYLGGGVADVMLHAPHDREYGAKNDRVLFIAPYFQEELVFAIDREKIDARHPLDAFTEHKVGVELDTLSDSYLLSAAQGRIRPNVVHFPNLTAAAQALVEGSLAGLMGPRSELEGALAGQDERFVIRSATLPRLSRSSWAIGMAVARDNENLGKKLAEAVMQLSAEGELQRIFQAHGVTYRPASATP